MDKGDGGRWELSRGLKRTVLEAVSPTSGERSRIQKVAEELIERVRSVAEEMGLSDIEPTLAGSVAKGTMGKDPDLDIFVVFPEGTPLDILESRGLEIGLRILEEPRKKYTQHPYITGRFEGFHCDIVPCLSIPKGSKVRTAVDRTPHHTRYINSRMQQEQKEEVLLLKSFLQGIGAYGAEDPVQGCSGYLTELLILRFGDLEGVLRFLSGIAPSGSAPGGCEEVNETHFSPAKAGIILFEDPPLADEAPFKPDRYTRMFGMNPLVVVDPVDARRNVASPISTQTLSYMSRAASKMIDAPHTGFFHPFSRRPLSTVGIPAYRPEEGEMFFELDLPGGEPGMVITQHRRSLRKLTAGMLRNGFEDVRIRFLLQLPEDWDPDPGYLRPRYTWKGETASPRFLVVIRTTPVSAPPEVVHWGPPLDNKRSNDFREKWGSRVRTDEEKRRFYTILRRETTDPGEIALHVWSRIVHGSAFSKPELKRLEGGRIPPELASVLSRGCDIWDLSQ
ncbi:MAG: CCA tRNA nucleotidyltransferase [Candidatus Thermoplasmatota archaeon]|nr:CCA tRNA nucleotidyltransferase [Candidatus Thermoplasmatota archaeon]